MALLHFLVLHSRIRPKYYDLDYLLTCHFPYFGLFLHLLYLVRHHNLPYPLFLHSEFSLVAEFLLETIHSFIRKTPFAVMTLNLNFFI